MAFALFRTESDQRINVPIRTNTQRFCLVRTVRYQAKGFSSPRNPTRAQRISFLNGQNFNGTGSGNMQSEASSSCWAGAEDWTSLPANRGAVGYAACSMPQT